MIESGKGAEAEQETDHLLEGIVVRAHGKFYEVDLVDQDVRMLATMRGTIKRERKLTDLVAVGDRVWMIDAEEGEARIERVAPRLRVLARPARGSSTIEQVIVANPDQAMFVFSLAEPTPSLGMLDRFLLLAETAKLPARIVVNKLDLASDLTAEVQAGFQEFATSYPVDFVSVETGSGLAGLRTAMAGKITVIAGPSGVGKSSLVNAIDDVHDRPTQPISLATGKGRHTTTGAALLKIGPSTYIADTPGMRALALGRLPERDLDHLYPEIRPFLGSCRYNDCRHDTEPDCAVQDAVANGLIPPGRFERYVRILNRYDEEGSDTG